MVSVMLIVTTFLFTTALCAVQLSSKDADIISLNERMTKMDALLQEMQSHSRAQEEHSRTLLTNLLSQLAQNTQELSTSKTEISKLKEINKKTLLDYTTTMAELVELKEYHNQTLGELEMVKNEVDSLQQDFRNFSVDSSLHGSLQLNSTTSNQVALSGVQPSLEDEMRNLKEHVKKLDAVLQEVQSHSQAQEQKYSAVLSNVLSQLTQASEELSASENVTEERQLKVENLEVELRILKETNNNTLLEAMEELVELKQSHNETQLKLTDLEIVKSEVNSLQQDFRNCIVHSCLHGSLQLNSTQTEALVSLAQILGQMNATGSNLAWQQHDIGFEASLTQTLNVSPSGKIVFDQVTHNEGNGYNQLNGYFTVPVSGTYLLWTNILYESHSAAIAFRIQTIGNIFGYAYGKANEPYGTASVTTVSYLKKGDRVEITPSMKINVLGIYSSAGAVLIKQH